MIPQNLKLFWQGMQKFFPAFNVSLRSNTVQPTFIGPIPLPADQNPKPLIGRIFANGAISPYIGINGRLSQIWVNRFTILLILIAVKLALFSQNVQYSLRSAEAYTSSSCQAVQIMVSNMESAPHFIAQAADKLVSNAMDHAVSGIISTLSMLVTGIENLIIFAIEVWIGTYACLIIAAIDGTASAAINATEAIVNFASKEANAIANDVDDALGALTETFDTMEDIVSDVGDFFTGGNGSIEHVNLTVAALRNFTISTSINSKLDNLRKNLPTYVQVKNATENIIKIPFQDLRKDLSDASNGIRFHISPFNVPPQEQPNFCSNAGIGDFFSQLDKKIEMAYKVLIILAIIGAFMCCLPSAYHEIRHWKFLNECAETDSVINKAGAKVERLNAIVKSASYYQTRLDMFLTSHIRDVVRAVLARWLLDYVLYHPALMLLLVGSAGILVSIFQYIILDIVRNEAPRVADAITTATKAVVADVDQNIQLWINNTNSAITNTEYQINHNLLGWVETGTSAVNSTLTEFSNTMNIELNDTFGNTPLEGPISAVMNCVIGNKIAEVQRALTWVHNNAHVIFPRIDKDLVPASAINGTGLQSAANSTSQLLGNTMRALIHEYESELKTQLLISIGLVEIWLLLATGAFLYCFYRLRGLEHNQTGDDDNVNSNHYSQKLPRSPSPPINVEDGWSLNSFQPPSFLRVDQYGRTTPSKMHRVLPTPLSSRRETIMEIKGSPTPRQVEVNEPEVARKSEHGYVVAKAF